MTEVTSYTEAVEAIRARVGELQLRYQDFDDLAGFPAGLSGKVFGPAQVKRLGPEKLFDAMRAAGLRFKIEVDPEQSAKMLARISDNYNPRQSNQARPENYASPVSTHILSRAFKHLSRLGGKARMRKMSKAERAAHARHAANKRWKAYRKRQKAAHRRRQRRQGIAGGRTARASAVRCIECKRKMQPTRVGWKIKRCVKCREKRARMLYRARLRKMKDERVPKTPAAIRRKRERERIRVKRRAGLY